MNTKKLRKDISASTLQTGFTQFFGLAIFYLISKFLDKEEFGQYNWSTAVGTTIIAIASLGLDLVYVKRIASGKIVDITIGLHFFHTLFSGLLLCSVLLAIQFILPNLLSYYSLFLLVFLNLTIANFANSLKLGLNGLEEYKKMAIISICINLFKFLVVSGLYFTPYFTIKYIVLGFIMTSIVEFALSYYFLSKLFHKNIKPVFIAKEYKQFIAESLPQLGVVLFDSALARIDWIILGIISTAAITAEYSFAYKLFELSKLPLLIIAPILLTRFSKLFINPKEINPTVRQSIQNLFKMELFLAMLIPIVMLSIWSDFIDYFTDHKYGAVNEKTYLVLSFCVPMHYIINFLWTLGFVQSQLRTIMFITMCVSTINIIANVLLIPHLNGLGAAISFLISTVIQLGLYILFIKQEQISLNLKTSLLTFINAILAVSISFLIEKNSILTALLSTSIYVVLSFITGILNLATLKEIIIRRNIKEL